METDMRELQNALSELRDLGMNKTQITERLNGLISVRTLRRYELGEPPKNKAVVPLIEDLLIQVRAEKGVL